MRIHSRKGIFLFSHTLRPGFISRKNYRNWEWAWELSKTVAGMMGFVYWLVIGVLWKFRGNDYINNSNLLLVYSVKWKFIIKKLRQSHAFYRGIIRKNISKNWSNLIGNFVFWRTLRVCAGWILHTFTNNLGCTPKNFNQKSDMTSPRSLS